VNARVIEEIVERLKGLPQELQAKVLEFTCALAKTAPRGVPGQQLLPSAGSVPREDLQRISQVIEEGCEQVDTSAW